MPNLCWVRFVIQAGKLLALWGQGIRNPQRELFDVDSAGAGRPTAAGPGGDRSLDPPICRATRIAGAQVLPQWTLLTTPREPLTVASIRGRKCAAGGGIPGGADHFSPSYPALRCCAKTGLRVACHTGRSVGSKISWGGRWPGKRPSGPGAKGAWQQFGNELAPYADQSPGRPRPAARRRAVILACSGKRPNWAPNRALLATSSSEPVCGNSFVFGVTFAPPGSC